MYGLATAPLRLLPAGVLVLLALSVAQSPLRLCPDCGIYVEGAGLLIEGQRPYVDFVKLNPPLNLYLNALPSLGAAWTGMHPVHAFNAAVLLLIAWSTWAVRRQLRAARPDTLDVTPDVVAAAWAAFSVYLWLTTPWRINDYGQREHLFVLLWLPYALLRCRRVGSAASHPRAAALLGVAAGIGASIKPHFLMGAIAAEAALAVTRRSLRASVAPESLALAGVVAIYAIHFAFLPAEVRNAFFGLWLPLLAGYYGAFALPDALAVKPQLAAAVVAGVGAAAWGLRARARDTAGGRLYASIGTFAVAGVGMYAWQAKGFFYHQIPALAGLVVLVSFAGTEALAAVRWRPEGRWRAGVALAAGLLGWGMIARAAPTVVAGRDDGNRHLEAFRRTIDTFADPGEPIAIFSTSVWPQYPTLAQLRRRQAVRFDSLIYLGVAMAARADDGGHAEALILGMLAKDLRDRRPPVIVIADRACARCTGGRVATHLTADPGLAEVFRNYRRQRAAGLPRGSMLFVRADRVARGDRARGR